MSAVDLSLRPWAVKPERACHVISSFVRVWDYTLDDDAHAQLIRPLVPLLEGTQSTEAVRTRRAILAADWVNHFYAATWLRLAGFPTHADGLVALPTMTTRSPFSNVVMMETVGSAKVAVQHARNIHPDFDNKGILKTADAAIRDAAGLAAMASWASVVPSEEKWWSWDIARYVALDAAYIAARAGVSLAPTVIALQASALDLVHRMISVTETAT